VTRPRPTRDDLAELGLLAATLLHELRQPIFAIKALAAMARREADGSVGDKLDRLLLQMEHVEGLLEVYGPLGGKRPPQETFDLAAEVRRALEALDGRRADLDVRVTVDLPDVIGVRGHPLAARQVLVNLVDNAYDAVAEAASREVKVEGRIDDGHARIVVTDSGPGVSADVQEQLFQPFVTSKPRGVGLGLFVSSRLVREVGGDLELIPEPSGGTQARLTWPVASVGPTAGSSRTR
jgi:C4-dicarboxylate-specific signal transduction histidine kinase